MNYVQQGGIEREPAPADRFKTIETGEFKGWQIWAKPGPFEIVCGPFALLAEAGGIRCAFRAEQRHTNGAGAVYGGCLMSFADFAAAAIATPVIQMSIVTVTLTTDMESPMYPSERIEATGEIVRAGGLIFVRGLASVEGRNVLSFQAIMRNIKLDR